MKRQVCVRNGTNCHLGGNSYGRATGTRFKRISAMKVDHYNVLDNQE